MTAKRYFTFEECQQIALKGISACCNGKKNYKTCLGFKWRFVVSKENNVSKIHLL